MCGASKASVVTDGSEWCKDVMDEAYVPIPYPEENFEPVECPHCLATLDVCTLNHGTKFYDEDGYDIIPIRMVAMIENGEPGNERTVGLPRGSCALTRWVT